MAHRRSPDVSEGGYDIWKTRDGIDAEFADVDGTGYVVRMRLTQLPSWQVRSITFDPGSSGEPITSGGVREFRFGLTVQGAIYFWLEYAHPDLLDDHGLSLLPSGRHRQKIETQSTMQAAIELYRRALARGSRSPTKDAAHALNRSPSYIAKLLSQARAQQLLGPASSGKAGER